MCLRFELNFPIILRYRCVATSNDNKPLVSFSPDSRSQDFALLLSFEVNSFLYFELSISYLFQVEKYIDQYQCYFLNYRFQNCHYKKNPENKCFTMLQSNKIINKKKSHSNTSMSD